MSVDMTETTQVLGSLRQALGDLDRLSDTAEMQSITDFPGETEEEQFENMEEHFARSSKTFKLSRKAIKALPKKISNKFILPLSMDKESDIEKFNNLKEQPFSFLEYNGAKFSIDLQANTANSWDETSDQLLWADLISERIQAHEKVLKSMNDRRTKRIKKMQKLNKIYNQLDTHIDYLKNQFTKKTEKYGNDKYIRFIGTRTVSNIKKIRESQTLAKTKLFALKNKRLYNDPKTFFDRMLKLFLGQTGIDIRNDLDTLQYTTRKDSEIGIQFLLFLLSIVENHKEFTTPILPILSTEEFNIGFENTDMLKVMAGHMFINTITITNVGFPNVKQICWIYA